MQKLLLSMSLFTCYLRLLPNVVFYRSGGGELIPWCPEVVLYLIQPALSLVCIVWEAPFARISSSLKRPVACRWRVVIFSNGQASCLNSSIQFRQLDSILASKRIMCFSKK